MNASAPYYYDEEGVEHIPKLIKSPSLPYVGQIPGGIFPGRAIYIKGLVRPNDEYKRFVIELCCGLLVSGDHQDNKALHFNPRFEASNGWFSGKGDTQIVLNTLVNNRWGTEERFANAFKEGEPFTIRILVLAEYFKLAVNGKHLCDFLYRLGINEVRTLYIGGNVNVDVIEFQGEPPTTKESGSPAAQGPIRKPKLPLVVPVPNGLYVGSRLSLTATPLMHAQNFYVNLKHDDDHFLHFRVDFPEGKKQGAIVRNSTYGGKWQREERQMSGFPFTRGITFDLVLLAEFGSMTIEINGEHFARFGYRGDVLLKNVNKIEFIGDIAVQLINFN